MEVHDNCLDEHVPMQISRCCFLLIKHSRRHWKVIVMCWHTGRPLINIDKLLTLPVIADVIKQWQLALLDRALEAQDEDTSSFSANATQAHAAYEGSCQALTADLR